MASVVPRRVFDKRKLTDGRAVLAIVCTSAVEREQRYAKTNLSRSTTYSLATKRHADLGDPPPHDGSCGRRQ